MGAGLVSKDKTQRYGSKVGVFNALAAWLIGLAMLSASLAQGQESRVILAFGDSLTAGLGLSDEASFPRQLEAALADQGVRVRVINAGVSGDTSAGGRARLDWAMAEAPELVIVELGANDGLRGLDPEGTYANLDDILTRLKKRGTKIVLAGMLAPPNLGREYGARFDGIYPRLAAAHDVLFYPFFLAGVAARPKLNQADGIHPNAAGVAVIVEGIVPYIVQALDGTG